MTKEPTPTRQDLKVTQEDRDAAAKLYEWFPILSSSADAALKTAQFIRDGGADGWNTVHLFRDHRIAALSAPATVDQGDVERLADRGCRVPPSGWWCSRERGHEGPCAARASETPVGAGWSAVPKDEAAHDERLTADELATLGNSISEWAYNHLAKGYAVSLTVREMKRILAALTPQASDRALREALEAAITHLTLVLGPRLCGETDGASPDEAAYPRTTFGRLRAARAFVLEQSAALAASPVSTPVEVGNEG